MIILSIMSIYQEEEYSVFNYFCSDSTLLLTISCLRDNIITEDLRKSLTKLFPYGFKICCFTDESLEPQECDIRYLN